MTKVRIRVSAVIAKNDKILLIHRQKRGREYWTYPGGGIEEGETAEEAVIREVKEETSLEASNPRFAFMVQVLDRGNKHPVYFVDVGLGTPELGGPEALKNNPNNWYQPEWIEISQLKLMVLFPKQITERLFKR
jgi:8-oxo-dGTP diphosphatase